MHAARRQSRSLARDPVLLGLVVVIMASVAIFVLWPLLEVLFASLRIGGEWSTANYELIATRRLYRNALVNSLQVAATVGVVGTLLGYVMAFVLTRTNVPFKRPLHLAMMLPIISPPFVGAVSILFLFGFNGLVTKQLLGLEDFNIYGRWGVVASQIFTFAPLAYLSRRGVPHVGAAGVPRDHRLLQPGARRDVGGRLADPVADRLRGSAVLGVEASVRDRDRQAHRLDLAHRLAVREV